MDWSHSLRLLAGEELLSVAGLILLLVAAWAAAMADLVKQHPDDLDAATLMAESLMNLQPWDYYLPDGTAKGQTATIVATTSSIGGGANGACLSLPVRRAFRTIDSPGMLPASKICVQR